MLTNITSIYFYSKEIFMSENSLRLTFTEKEFCKQVGISRVTAWRLRESGKLPHCRIGNKILYTSEQIKQFLETHSNPVSINKKFNQQRSNKPYETYKNSRF